MMTQKKDTKNATKKQKKNAVIKIEIFKKPTRLGQVIRYKKNRKTGEAMSAAKM